MRVLRSTLIGLLVARTAAQALRGTQATLHKTLPMPNETVHQSNGTAPTSNETVVMLNATELNLLGVTASGSTWCYYSRPGLNEGFTCIEEVNWHVSDDGMDWDQAQCEVKRKYPSDCDCLDCEPTSLSPSPSLSTWCYDNKGHNPNNRQSSCIDDVHWKMSHDGMNWHQAQCEVKQWYPSDCYCLDC
jgi:hypothetical protein